MKKRLNEILSQGKMNAEVADKLFNEYEQDKANGVSNEESEARAMLILGNSALVSHVLSRKFALEYNNVDLDEFSVGKMGLIKAIDNYDVNQGVKFSTYAYRVIYNEILMYYRNMAAYNKTAERDKISIEECFLPDSNNEIMPQYARALSEPADFVTELANEDFMKDLRKYWVHLIPSEQVSVVYSLGLYNTETLCHMEIAKMLNKSRSYISKHVKSGINKLKAMLLPEEELSEDQRLLRYHVLKEIYPLADCIKSYFNDLEL